MRKRILQGSLTALVMALSTTASATLIDFSYTNLGVAGGSTQTTVGMSVDGIAVDVTAYTIVNDGNGNISSLSQITGSGTGIYVSSSSSGNLGVRSSRRDGNRLDGGNSASDPDEGLLFVFDQLVSLDYINFDYFSGSDDFNLTVDGVRTLWDFNAADVAGEPLVTSSPDTDEFLFAGITGTEFLFWADGNSDSFRIDRMDVSAVAVPGPSSILLLSLGLAGLGFFRRND